MRNAVILNLGPEHAPWIAELHAFTTHALFQEFDVIRFLRS